MAEDKLIFPVGFDIEKGVKEAQSNVDKYLDRIAKAVEKYPISVKLQIDKDGGISSTIKAERQRAAKELTGLKKEMAEIDKEWNALSAKDRGGEMGARLMARYRELTQEAKGYTATLGAAVKLEDRLARQREKSANAAAKAAQKTREYNKELQDQDGYLSRLIKRLAVYAGFSAIRTFLTGVRDVTAEFELQRVSLGAIIQDQNRANQLFSEIKSFALKSPLKILDLTKYVKQVAAYRIETDKLFDTTKRLADVSVGLGVDMGRLVLAYGQVKAASYLRAAEIRQFTEAGIPMLELLAEKFTEIQGKAVSTEQVMDLVSKRAVSFSMVEEIFKDMTDAGGMFYNMQEKQAQTLFGMWSKLGDAAAVMYEQIGNVGWVNEGMKAGIGLLEKMMRNWRSVASAVEVAGIAFLAIKGNQTIMKLMEVNTIAAAAATRNYARAQEQLNTAKRAGNTLSAKVAGWRKQAAQMNRIAANSTDIWTVANYKLRASLLSLRAAMSANWVGVLLSAIATLATWLISARQEANRLNNELSKISAEGATKADEMTRNFERLAKVVVESADGSKQQNEALEELKRTYSDVIPAQDLTIDKLREMKGAYDEVTRAIREKIYQQNLEQQLTAIQENYAGKISKGEKKTKELLEGYGLSPDEVGRVMMAIREAINNGLLTAEDDIETRMAVTGKIVESQIGKTIKTTESVYRTVAGTNQQIFVGTRVTNAFSKLSNAITKIVKPTAEMNAKIEEQTAYVNGLSDSTGRYSNILKDVAKNVAAFSSSLSPSSNEYKLEREQYMIEQYANGVRSLFEDAAKNFPAAAKINIDDFFVDGDINWDAAIAAAEKAAPQFKEALSRLKNAYEESLPRFDGWKKELQGFSNVVDGLNKGKPIKLFDDTTINDFRSLDDALQQTAKQYKDNKALAEQYADTLKSTTISLETRTQTEELKAEAETMAELSYAALVRFNALKLLQKSGGNGGGDNRLQNLKEIEQTLTAINTKYEELVKKEGKTAALDYVKKNYASTLEYVNKLGKKFGLKFEMPTDFKDLQTYRKNIQKVIETLKMKGYEKAAIELELKVAEGNQDKLEKQIEKQLKELADRISRTKTAKEFYDKVLRMTGDYELAATFSMSVYGNTGERLKADIVKQIESAFKSGDKTEIDLSSAINYNTKQVDYAKLRRIYDQYQNHLIAKNKETARKLIADGEKASADQILLWLKDLEKAKTFAEKRVELARYTANQIAAIERSNLPQTQKETMTEQYKIRENKETAKLEYEAFKNSPMYTAMFEKLDAASTAMLKNMQKRLIALKSEWKNLDPTQIKELQSRLDEVNDQLTIKNPYRTLIQSFKEWKTLREQGSRKDAEQELINKTKELERAEALLVQRIEQAEAAQQTYNAAVAEYGMGSQQANQAKLQLAFAKQQERQQTKIVDTTRESVNESEKLVNSWKALGQQTGGAFAQMDAINQAIVGLANDLKDAFGGFGSDADAQYFDDIVSSFSNLSSGISNIAQGVMSGNPVAIIQGIGSAIKGIIELATAGKIRRANKEIEKQQEILDQLEYSYERLEKAAEKAFGGDYIRNFKDQQANLQAQIAATEKQLAAEQSKGKKTDDDKVKEYKEQIRDLKDELADMQGTLAEQFLGTDLTSAARDFAKAWLDAYKEFSNTADAMSEKFQEMVENMVVEGAMAAVMERALKPMFDMINEMGDDDFYSQDFWREVSEKAAQGAKDADAGASTLMNFLEKAGISIRDLGGDLTGISRDIASASEESINGLAAGINTQNYYISYVPQIAEHVAAMRAILEGGGAPIQSGQGITDLITLQNQSLTHLQAINQHTAETVTECRRIADRCTAMATQCQNMAEDIHRVVVPKGTKGSYAMQTQVS